MSEYRRRPGCAPGRIVAGSITDRLFRYAQAHRVFGYAQAVADLGLSSGKSIDDPLGRLMFAGRIRPVDRGVYALADDGVSLRADGSLAIVADGKSLTVPPALVEKIRDMLR